MNITKLQHSVLPRTLVTGATSGIGLELAVQLHALGVPVVALGRDPQRLAALQARCPGLDTVVCDLSDVAALPALAASWVQRFPDLAAVVHNAAVQDNVRLDAEGYGASEIRTEVDINLVAPLVLTQALLPHLQSQAQAWVLCINSGLAWAPKRSSAVYSATKAGLHMFTRALRVQLQGSAVCVAEATMPLVDTAMTQGRGQGKLPAAEAARQVIQGMMQRRSHIGVGKARALPLLLRLAPGVFAKMMLRG